LRHPFFILNTMLALGIDIGGTNIAIGVVNLQGDILFEKNYSTKSFSSIELVSNNIYEAINNLSFYSDIIGIGIGAPNGNHFTGEIQFAPNLPWKGIIPVKEIFQKRFSKQTILTNDANAAADGEKLFGAAKDYKNFVQITLGTGLGSGIYIDNKIVYGSQGLAGEYGHIRILKEGRKCNCGRLGCLETYASSTGVVKSFTELEHPLKKDSILNSLSKITAKDIFDAAINKQDPFSEFIVEYTAEILGCSLAEFACFSNPEAYILFGGIAQSGDFFSNKVKTYMEGNLLNIYKNNIDVKTSLLHDKNAAILGNAASIFKLNQP
jgi:glucokinase